jgi:hypothetical protein
VADRRHVPGARLRLALPVLPVLLLAATAGCGGSDEQADYCTSFLDTRQELSDLASRQSEAAKDGEGLDVLSPTLAAFEELRSASPSELRDEWDTLVFAYRDLAQAVETSGVDPVEFRVGEVPEGLAPEDRKALSRVASKLGSPRVVEAANGIEGYSAQVCEVDDSGDEPTDEP